jgi:hypothetical protein
MISKVKEIFDDAVIEVILSRTVPVTLQVDGVGEMVEMTTIEKFTIYNINKLSKTIYYIKSYFG